MGIFSSKPEATKASDTFPTNKVQGSISHETRPFHVKPTLTTTNVGHASFKPVATKLYEPVAPEIEERFAKILSSSHGMFDEKVALEALTLLEKNPGLIEAEFAGKNIFGHALSTENNNWVCKLLDYGIKNEPVLFNRIAETVERFITNKTKTFNETLGESGNNFAHKLVFFLGYMKFLNQDALKLTFDLIAKTYPDFISNIIMQNESDETPLSFLVSNNVDHLIEALLNRDFPEEFHVGIYSILYQTFENYKAAKAINDESEQETILETTKIIAKYHPKEAQKLLPVLAQEPWTSLDFVQIFLNTPSVNPLEITFPHKKSAWDTAWIKFSKPKKAELLSEGDVKKAAFDLLKAILHAPIVSEIIDEVKEKFPDLEARIKANEESSVIATELASKHGEEIIPYLSSVYHLLKCVRELHSYDTSVAEGLDDIFLAVPSDSATVVTAMTSATSATSTALKTVNLAKLKSAKISTKELDSVPEEAGGGAASADHHSIEDTRAYDILPDGRAASAAGHYLEDNGTHDILMGGAGDKPVPDHE